MCARRYRFTLSPEIMKVKHIRHIHLGENLIESDKINPSPKSDNIVYNKI